MHWCTYRKAFMAKAAIECMKEIVRYDLEHEVINKDTEGDDLKDAIQRQAGTAAWMAEELADSLERNWPGQETIFFDPTDQPDNVGQCVADAINDFTEKYFGE